MTPEEIQIEQKRLIQIFRENSLPTNRGIFIEFLPSDEFIRQLTNEFNVEFAAVFTNKVKYNYLYVGTLNSIQIPLITAKNHEILIKHSHPLGTKLPSIHDINWLKAAQAIKSPQKKSVILPHDEDRVTFNINSKYAK